MTEKEFAPPTIKYHAYHYGPQAMNTHNCITRDEYDAEIKRMRELTGEDYNAELMAHIAHHLGERHRQGPVINEQYVFSPFCWCEQDSCQWCGPDRRANFHWKPTDLAFWWYKHPARGQSFNRPYKAAEAIEISKALGIELHP